MIGPTKGSVLEIRCSEVINWT